MTTLGSQLVVLILLSYAAVGLESKQQPPHSSKPLQHQRLSSSTSDSDSIGHNFDSREQEDSTKSNMKQRPSDTVIKAFEAGLLNMFGLKKRPKPKKDKIHIPEYIKELYLQHTGNQDRSSVNFNIRNTNTHSANTIRSFYHTEKAQKKRVRKGFKQSDEEQHSEYSNMIDLHFDVSSIPHEETLTAAELRIFRHDNRSETDPESWRLFSSQRHRIDIYEIVHPATSQQEAITRLLDTKIINPETSSWEHLDVKPAVQKWKQSPHLNHGLQVQFLTESGTSSRLQHVRLRRSTHMKDEQWAREQPLLLAYSDDGKNSKIRTKRGTKHKKRSRHLRKRRKDECKRHELYVDFSDVGWDDWIVAPPGYQAYYCQGECVFPLPEYINATNHAIVQTLVHSVDPTAVPRPCCVPTELSPISMLYLDEYEKVVLKNYQDMVVQGCGCR